MVTQKYFSIFPTCFGGCTLFNSILIQYLLSKIYPLTLMKEISQNKNFKKKLTKRGKMLNHVT